MTYANKRIAFIVNGDRLTRATAALAVLAVAVVAGWVSYRHCLAVVTAHGETGAVGYAYPATIDGLIVGASLVLLDTARHHESAPRLAWWMLAAGIVATLAVNVLAGITSGALGAIVAAWPAAAFVGCYELVMVLVRASAARVAELPALAGSPESDAVSVPVPADAEQAALLALRATHAAGNPLSGRQLETRFGITRAQATKVRKLVLTEPGDQTDTEPVVSMAA